VNTEEGGARTLGPDEIASPDPNATVAEVNGVAILAGRLDAAVKSSVETQASPLALKPDEVARIRLSLLQELIDRELLYQKSVAEGLTPSQGEIDSAVAEARSPFGADEEWESHLKRQGIESAQFEELINQSLCIDKLVRTEVMENLKITDEQVERYYQDHPEEMRHAERVRARHILLRFPEGADPGQKAEVRGRAEKALARARSGEDFAELARELSEDPGSARRGGDLDFFGRGQMVPPFEEAAFGLDVGAMSDLVESEFGYHVIQVTDRQESRPASLEEVAENLRAFLRQLLARERMEALVASLRASADIRIN
jgi:peptidyl-prolyl cis-trans isomerase C